LFKVTAHRLELYEQRGAYYAMYLWTGTAPVAVLG